MAVTRIKNNQITDSTITGAKIANTTLTGGLFASSLTLNSNVSIVGNLSVTGTTSTVSSTNTFINDPLVVYNNGYTGDLSNYSIGMLVNRNLASLADYGSVNVAWAWDEAEGAFVAIATTDTGSGITSINNSGYGNVKLGNAEIVSKLTAGSLVATTFEATNVSATTLVATNFSSGNAQISGGYADGFTIGGNTAATGTFTTTNHDEVVATSGNAATWYATTLNSTAGNITTLTAPTVDAQTTTTTTLNATTGNITTATAGSMAVSDLTDNRVVIAGTSGELEDDANFTFDGTELALTGLLRVTGNVTADNISIDGQNIGTPGGGDLTIQAGGGADNVIIKNSQLIEGAHAVTLDAVTLNSTAGNITTLTSPTIDAITTTSTTLNATTGNITTATAGSMAVSDLTNNRIVIAGTSGELEDDANLTWDGSDMGVTGGLNVTGDLAVDNIAINGNDITSTDTDGDINITPDGTGEVVISSGLVTTLNATTATAVTLNSTAGNITTLTAPTINAGTTTSATVNATTGNVTTISGTTATYTTVNAGTTTSATINATAGNVTTLGATNFSSSNVQATGGFVDNVHVGANVAATGNFTTLDAESLDVDNITINGNDITSTDTDGDINITPDGTGSVVIDGLNYPQADGSANQVIQTDGSGQLSFATVLTDIVADTTPQLGGDLDVNGNDIVSVSNGDINITPDGAGEVVLSTAAVSDLTDNRVVIAGTAGALEDDANLTYNGTTLATNGFSATTADIDGGTIDGTTIGGASAAAGTFTDLSATNAALTGGYVDNVHVGANTAATGSFTTLEASGTSTLAQVDATILNGATLNVTNGNVTTLTAPTINAGTTTSATVNATTGNVTTLTATNVINTTLVATNFSSSNVDINGGAVDGTAIGAASASTGAFTTLTASGNTTVTSTQGSGNASSGALVVDGGVGIAENLNVGGDVVITGDLTVEGDTTTINTATLNVEDLNITIADGAADAASANGAGITVDGANATITYASADDSWNFNKLLKATDGSITTLTSTNVINTTLVATNFSSGNVQATGGYVDNVHVGANVAATGAFTTLEASGTSTLAGVDATSVTSATVNATSGNITTLTAPTINAGTTTSATVNATTGNITTATAGSLAVSDLTDNRVVIAGTSGELEDDANFTFNGTTLALTAAMDITGDLDIDNININGNDVTSTDTDGDINITPDGTGSVVIDGLSHPQADGTAGQALITDGSAQLSFSTVMTDLVQDTTPQLGGDLDVNGNEIVSVSNGNIALTPNGTGEVIASTLAVSDLTNDRVVFAGVNGALEDSTNLTYDGTNLTTNGLVATTADINGGTIDGTNIGVSSQGSGAFTTLSASGTSTVAQVDATVLNSASLNTTAGNITTLTSPTVDAQTTTTTTLNATAGNITTLTSPTVNAITTTSTTVNATTGNVTTLTAGSLAVSDLTDNRLVVAGTSGELEDDANLTWDGSDLDVTGGVNITGDLAVDNIAINGNDITSTDTNGDINITPDGTGEVVISSGLVTTLNAVTVNPVTLNATTGNVTTLTATDVINTTLVATNFSSSNVDVNGGAIDGTPIGATSADTGAFTTLSASGTSTLAQVDATILNGATVNATAGNITTLTSPTINAITTTSTTLNATTGNVTTLTAPTINGGTTTTATLNSTSGNITTLDSTTVNAITGTITTVNTTTANVDTGVIDNLSSANVMLTGGDIDGVSIGASTAGTGAFTTLAASGVSTLAGNIVGTSGTASTSDITGALVLTGTGGAGIGGNINVGGGALLNIDQTANYDVKVSGANDTSLLWARSATAYDAVLIGNSAVVSDLVNGAKLQINTTDSILLPVGTTAQRPGSVGGTDTTGMLRYNSSIDNLEFYDGTEWNTAGTTFTVIASETFDGDDSTTGFTLSEAQTTASCIVSINGVVQLPTTAYSVSSTTLTFTEAPATGDKIEVRKLTTTQTISGLSSSNSYVQVEAADDGVKFYSGASAATLRWTIDTDGHLIPAANTTQNIGSPTAQIGDIYVSGGTIHLGVLQLKDNGDNTMGVYQSDGITEATINVAAENAAAINLTATNSTDSTHYISFVEAATGTEEVRTDTGLTYNPSSGTLTSTTFVTGNQGDVRFSDADSSNFVAFQAPATVSSNVTWTLPDADASVSGYALVSDASGTLSWAAAGATISQDEATNTDFNLYFASATSGALTAVKYDSGVHYNPSTGTLTSSVVDATTLKIGGTSVTSTATELNVLDGIPGTLTATELGYVDGVTSAIQTQLDGKQVTITGAATTIDTENLTASRALVSDGSGKVAVSAVTSTEIGYLDGVTSAIQTQLNAKAPLASPALTGTATAVNLTVSGDLTVNGTTTTVASTNTVVSDNLIELNNGAASNANDSGIIIERGSTGDNVFMGWDESVDRIKFATTTATGASTGDLTLTSANIEANYAHVTSTQSLYADLAENYQADANYSAGTVLEFGGAEEVTTATENSRRVAGIVSTDPAHLMNGGLKGSNVVPLALMGRVPCLAIGPVVKGDMMVSAGFGYAKADANPATGTVIGKALEALADGEKATIEVVVGKV